jgi:Asp-tRNA(Asn)/Glu-tRNA(Gln) amidotransferase A subunit family amidase
MIARWKLAVFATVALFLVLGYGWWRVDAAAYARGVRDQKIKTIAATEMLNDRIEEAEEESAAAAARAADAARELHRLQMENAYDRANDPAAAGVGLPHSERLRVSRVP